MTNKTWEQTKNKINVLVFESTDHIDQNSRRRLIARLLDSGLLQKLWDMPNLNDPKKVLAFSKRWLGSNAKKHW